MKIFNKDKYIKFLILIPGIGGLIAFCIVYYFKKMNNKLSTYIIFKYYMLNAVIFFGITFLLRYLFLILFQGIYYQYFPITAFVVAGILINLLFVLFYKNNIYDE